MSVWASAGRKRRKEWLQTDCTSADPEPKRHWTSLSKCTTWERKLAMHPGAWALTALFPNLNIGHNKICRRAGCNQVTVHAQGLLKDIAEIQEG